VIESRIKPDVLQKLTAEGHVLHVQEEYSDSMGRGNAVMYNSKTKVKFGASDARADGSAEPEPPKFPQ
jgi:gamma-glutamyltranspeptidase